MKTRFSIVLWTLLLIFASPLARPPAVGQQKKAGPPSWQEAQGLIRPDRDPKDLAKELAQKHQSGPQLPYHLVANWPNLPKGYNFGECSGVDVDKQDNVWIANRGAWPIMEFDKTGKFIQSWTDDTVRLTPSNNHGTGSHGIRVDPDGNIWLLDVDGHLLHKYTQQGRRLMVIGNRQGGASNNDSHVSFNRPTNLWFLPNRHFYVSDGYGNARVVEFDQNGDYVRHWGTYGTGDGQFNLPHSVTVDSKGLVYVADRSNLRVQVFDPSGKFLAKWTDVGDPWGVYYVAKENAIYMCDGLYCRISKLSLEGKVLGVLSSWGKAPGRLDFAHEIAVDSEGSIYVAEIKNLRVQKWVRNAGAATK
jgi:DNA-binding beta-propeller fold protein YncE